MLVVVSYDVSTENQEGRRRLRRVAKICEGHGQRVQNSVFECLVDASQWVKLRARLVAEIKSDEDSLRFYFLGNEWANRIEHIGTKPSYDPEGPLIV
jgi:CRISPR-associated protein Cas2